MIKGTIKVMVGRTGTKIQEELNDQIKIYTVEQWNAELARREKLEKREKAKLGKNPVISKADADESDSDEDDEDDAPKPLRARRGSQPKATKKSPELSDEDTDDGDFDGEND